jgi:hypothetical protein
MDKNTVFFKTSTEIVARLEEIGREILATVANTGREDLNARIDELLGTLFACVDETANEIVNA